MKTIKRYLKIYKTLIKLNIASTIAYRADFYSSLISSFGWSIYVISSMLLLTARTTNVFGWSREELLVAAGMYNVVFSVFYVLFSRNFNEFADTIHYGRLDGILMRPVDAQFLMTCQHMIFGNIVRFSLGTIFLFFMLFQLHIPITIVSILGFFALLAVSITIIYSLWMLVITITIWFTNLVNLVDLMYDINGVSRFPQEMFKSVSVFLLIAVFPLTLVVITPVKFLLHKMFVGDIVAPVVAAIGMFILSRFFWKFALRFYTSASG
jgi:ABC-2 type transport system permease protein